MTTPALSKCAVCGEPIEPFREFCKKHLTTGSECITVGRDSEGERGRIESVQASSRPELPGGHRDEAGGESAGGPSVAVPEVRRDERAQARPLPEVWDDAARGRAMTIEPETFAQCWPEGRASTHADHCWHYASTKPLAGERADIVAQLYCCRCPSGMLLGEGDKFPDEKTHGGLPAPWRLSRERAALVKWSPFAGEMHCHPDTVRYIRKYLMEKRPGPWACQMGLCRGPSEDSLSYWCAQECGGANSLGEAPFVVIMSAAKLQKTIEGDERAMQEQLAKEKAAIPGADPHACPKCGDNPCECGSINAKHADDPPEETEFHLAVTQIVLQYVGATSGDKQRLAVLAKAQAVASRVVRRLITRGELLNKTPAVFTPSEITVMVREEDAADEKEGTGR